MKQACVFFLILATLLSACGQSPTQLTDTITQSVPAALANPTLPPPTATLSKTFTPNPTATPQPSQTPVPPTDTPIPPTSTEIHPTSTPIPPTPEVHNGMVLIPPGSLTMGSENGTEYDQPTHTVTLQAFYLDQYEVSNALFAEFVNQTGYQTDAEEAGWSYTTYSTDPISGVDWQHPMGPESNLIGLENAPVVQVTWSDAVAYCRWRGGRLPTEAEWEYAAHGGLEGNLYPWGNDDPVCQLGAVNGANFQDCSVRNLIAVGNPTPTLLPKSLKVSGQNEKNLIAVGSFSPNGYGLYDMAGNVAEWTSSLFWPYPYNATDGREDFDPSGSHVFRGGGMRSYPKHLQVTSRISIMPEFRYDLLGFRCARTP